MAPCCKGSEQIRKTYTEVGILLFEEGKQEEGRLADVSRWR